MSITTNGTNDARFAIPPSEPASTPLARRTSHSAAADLPMDRPDASGPAPPIQPSSKSTAAAPMLNSEMELGTFAGQGQVPAAQAPEDDIMQIARIGDIPAMERLFEAGTYDATYSDEEGITPLHVSPGLPPYT